MKKLADTPAGPTEIEVLTEIRDALKTRQGKIVAASDRAPRIIQIARSSRQRS